jgi:hypothetical protein
VPDLPMRLYALAPEVKCPGCGADLTFIRVRKFGDLYQCSCNRQVLHYRKKETKACGYAPIYSSGAFGVWTACGDRHEEKGE